MRFGKMVNNSEAPNVVSESVLKHLVIEEGHAIEVVCQGEPFVKYGHWRGSWFIKAIDLDSDTEKLLVPFRIEPRKGIQVREFKTASGVLSFAFNLGFKNVTVPMAVGQKARMRLAEGS